CLLDVQIAQGRNLRQLVAELAGKSPRGSEVRTHHRDFNRCGRTEVQNAADDIARLEGELHLGEVLREAMPEFLLERSQSNRRRWLERHLQDPFMRAAGPQEYRVDRVRRRLHTD